MLMTNNSVSRLLDAAAQTLEVAAEAQPDPHLRRQLQAAIDIARYIGDNAEWKSSATTADAAEATQLLDLLTSAGYAAGKADVLDELSGGLDWLIQSGRWSSDAELRRAVVAQLRGTVERQAGYGKSIQY
jgi:hypothetical protein